MIIYYYLDKNYIESILAKANMPTCKNSIVGACACPHIALKVPHLTAHSTKSPSFDITEEQKLSHFHRIKITISSTLKFDKQHPQTME